MIFISNTKAQGNENLKFELITIKDSTTKFSEISIHSFTTKKLPNIQKRY